MSRNTGRPGVIASAREAWALHRDKGSPSAIARACGITQPSVSNWKQVPAERVMTVARLLNVEPSDLRPDLFIPPHRWGDL